MSYIEGKLSVIAGEALSKISDKSRKYPNKAKEQDEIVVEQQETLRQAAPVEVNEQNRPIGWQTSPFAAGIPFGGDACTSGHLAPPGIGFRIGESKRDDSERSRAVVASQQCSNSSESLYQGDCRKLSWYPRLFLACILRLLLFVGKIFEDLHTTKYYNLIGLTGHFLISAATLLLPTIMFTLYRVARYLQLVLPAIPEGAATGANSSGPASKQDSQRLAARSPSVAEDEGLVTARQTPTVASDEFHDTKSHQEHPLQQPAVLPNVDKMGDLPDKRTTSIVLGASEQLLHGMLFIFWHLKRQVDVLSFLVGRVCKWRAPSTRELQHLEAIQTDSNGLEWFQDFYAAFLAILTQVYTLGLLWSVDGGEPATSGQQQSSPGAVPEQVQLSRGAIMALGQVARSLEPKDLLVLSQLLVSLAVLFSLLMAVRRLDDGPLTLGLSVLGWGSLFAARILVIAFSFLLLGASWMLPLVGAHVLVIAAWIYKIALDSHDDKPSERLHEAMWDQELEEQQQQVVAARQEAAGAARPPPPASATSQWLLVEHVTLLTQILALFAIPSLFYWPIMFNLKLHARPFKYLLVVLVQNFVLILAIWWQARSPSPGQLYALGAAGALSILGFIFISLYVACKPSLTEYFARADEQFNRAKQAGVYYEYCSRVFKMPDLSKHSFQRLLAQRQEQIETQVDG